MKINTIRAGQIQTSNDMLNAANVQLLADKACICVSRLSENLKTADNVGRLFYLMNPQDGYAAGAFYKLVTKDEKYVFTSLEDDNDTSLQAPAGKVFYKTSVYGKWLEAAAQTDGGKLTGFANKADAVEVILPSKDADGNAITAIDGYAFSGCNKLASITIPDGVTAIGGYAFNGCAGLLDISIPNSVENIGSYAFNACGSLAHVIFGNGVSDIGENAFYACNSLSSVVFIGKTPEEVQAMDGYSWGIADTSIIHANATAGRILYRTSVNGSWLESSATVYSSVLTEFVEKDIAVEVIVPRINTSGNSIVSIANKVFQGSGKLASVAIPDSVTNIGDEAFKNCKKLDNLVVPDSITNIGANAFNGCSSLTNIVFKGNKPAVGTGAFANVNGNCTGYVYIDADWSSIDIPGQWENLSLKYYIPDGAIFYKTSYGWNQADMIVNNRVFNDFEGRADAINAMFSDKDAYGNSITAVGTAFKGLSTKLKNVVIPAGIQQLSSSAFSNCAVLSAVDFSEQSQLSSIGNYAFYKCSALKQIALPDSLASIGQNCFADSGIARISFGGTETIENYAFQSCWSLGSVLLENVQTVGEYAFARLNLSTVKFGERLSRLKKYAFTNCSNLANVWFEGDMPNCAENVFSNVKAGCIAHIRSDKNWNGLQPGDAWQGMTIEFQSI